MKILPPSRPTLRLALLAAGLAGLFASEPTRVGIVPDTGRFTINGSPTYPGTAAEGLLMNSRMVSGLFDDLHPDLLSSWAYSPSEPWNPDRNTLEFLAAMGSWRRAGLLAITLNLQGGSPKGYDQIGCFNSAFRPDGSLKQVYLDRLTPLLREADRLGMVVILGYFYKTQANYFNDETAVRNAAFAATDWIVNQGFTHVMVEIANESHDEFLHANLRPARIAGLIADVKTRSRGRLLVGTSFGGGVVPSSSFAPLVVQNSDFLLVHGNSAQADWLKNVTPLVDSGAPPNTIRAKPILVNEDDNYDFANPQCHLNEALKRNISWGFFDYRRTSPADARAEGFQSVPVDWTIAPGTRKETFFTRLAAITGGSLVTANTPPTITPIANPSPLTPPTNQTAPLAFTIGDVETPNSLTVTPVSLNTALVPDGNILVTGTGAQRTVSVQTRPGVTGKATIALVVGDGIHSTVGSFVVTVANASAPTISPLVPVPGAPLTWTCLVGDAQTPAEALEIMVNSSNRTTVPLANIRVTGTGASRTLTVTPGAQAIPGSSSTVTVTVYDGVLSSNAGALKASTAITVTAPGANTAPTISTVADQTLGQGASSPLLAFTIGDAQTPADQLTVTPVSANQALVPTSGVVLSGSGATRQVRIIPAAGQSGTSLITLTVSDGTLTAMSQFRVTVTSDGTVPMIQSLTLIDTLTNLPVPGFDPMPAVSVIDRARLDIAHLTVRANRVPDQVGSVRFGVDGVANVRTESVAPYFLAGDAGTVYTPWSLGVGDHDLVATPFTLANGGGVGGQALAIRIRIGSAPQAAIAPVAAVTAGTPVLLDATVTDDGHPGVPITYAWSKASGPGTVTFANPAAVDTTAGFSTPGTYVLALTASDSLFTSSAQVTVEVVASPSALAVVSFTVIDSVTDLPVPGYDPIPGDSLPVPSTAIGRWTLRANIGSAAVGSVRFSTDDNPSHRVESVSPYALQGDGSLPNGLPDYAPWMFKTFLPIRTVTATPFSLPGAGGTAGAAKSVILLFPAGG